MGKRVSIGQQLRTKRGAASLREVAARAGLSPAGLHGLEHGSDETALGLRYATLRKVAFGYQVELAELLSWLDKAAVREARVQKRRQRQQHNGAGHEQA